MKFGDVPLDDAAGAILVHSIPLKKGRLKKGSVLADSDIALLRDEGHTTVAVARLEADDVGEDEAASRIADLCRGPNLDLGSPFTGRCNLTATEPGLAVIDTERVNRLNQVDEAATLATVRPFDVVEPGQLVATVKIVTFAVGRSVIEAANEIIGAGDGLVRVAAFRPVSVGLLQTRLPRMKASLFEKAVGAMQDRLAALGTPLAEERRCDHAVGAVAASLTQMSQNGREVILVLGASAIVDRRDVVPQAIERAGGAIEHFGMPVDPGHLTLLARLGDTLVLGLPGSARSPRLHGFDWILQRRIAGLDVSGRDIMDMGVGGLLKDIPGRPMPRAEARRRKKPASPPRIAALVLAAGQSRRMGAINKLLADVDGLPMVSHIVSAALASKASPVIVVTGHESKRVRAALDGKDVTFIDNPDYADGLSTSLRRGLAALPADVDGVVVCLGDMPNVTAAHLDRLIASFAPNDGKSICVPTSNGKRGNPVLWAKAYFREIADVAGDVGARHLIGAHEDAVCEVVMPDSGVLLDLDTPEALEEHLAGRKATS